MDKFTWRGVIYCSAALVGIGYELFFRAKPDLFPIVMYSVVGGIGLVCIFVLKDEQHRRSKI